MNGGHLVMGEMRDDGTAKLATFFLEDCLWPRDEKRTWGMIEV